jgi:hypothetical protein
MGHTTCTWTSGTGTGTRGSEMGTVPGTAEVPGGCRVGGDEVGGWDGTRKRLDGEGAGAPGDGAAMAGRKGGGRTADTEQPTGRRRGSGGSEERGKTGIGGSVQRDGVATWGGRVVG